MSAAASPARRRWVLGLTGGIASGKSAVAGQFARLGVPVIDLDLVSREVVAPGTPLLEAVLRRFGQDLRLPDGGLDRRALRTRVFMDDGERRQLEALLHPAIHARADALLAAASGPYQIVVNPLLAESAERGRYDRVLVVDCDPLLQRSRLVARDGADAALADAMIAAQATRAQRLAIADDVLLNDAGLDALPALVESLHRRYLGLAQSSSTIAR